MPEEKQTHRFVDLARPSWFKQEEGSSIWVTGFRVLRIPKEVLSCGARIVDLTDVRAIVLYGELSYTDPADAKIEIVNERLWRFDVAKVQERKTPEGTYLLLLCPFDVDGHKGSEPATRHTISVAVGLLAVLHGRNMVYQRLFDNIVEMRGEKTTSFSRAVENPLSFPQPDIGESRLDVTRHADRGIAAMAQPTRNRVALSLRWFESALYDGGIDGFLKYWIALETLGMPDTNNIRPLNETMALAYGIDYQQASTQFAIGRLFGLRSRIVHEGSPTGINSRLLTYIEAVYADVLFVHLGLPAEHRAAAVLSNPQFDILKLLDSS